MGDADGTDAHGVDAPVLSGNGTSYSASPTFVRSPRSAPNRWSMTAQLRADGEKCDSDEAPDGLSCGILLVGNPDPQVNKAVELLEDRFNVRLVLIERHQPSLPWSNRQVWSLRG